MDWKDEEVADVRLVLSKRGGAFLGLDDDDMRCVMTRAVELAAARGGTMTAGEIDDAIAGTGEGLREYISTLGARNAVLEAEVANWKGCADGNENAWRLADGRTARMEEERDGLRERLSAAEEGNRELAIRAQQAEGLVESLRRTIKEDRLVLSNVTAERDQWKTEHGSAMRRWKAEKERADALEARCASLSAAGQGAHVDKAANIQAEQRPTISELEAILASPEGAYRIDVQPNGEVRAVKRYPCPPTCTHDDSAKPGHPERVKERSEAVKTLVTPEPINGLGPFDAYDRGAEAMRAACWEAVQTELQKWGVSQIMLVEVKSAIEGAVS